MNRWVPERKDEPCPLSWLEMVLATLMANDGERNRLLAEWQDAAPCRENCRDCQFYGLPKPIQ